MKTKIKWILITLSLLSLLVLLSFPACSKQEDQSAADKELYTCGMHPNVIQEGPGNCPICGMKLTPLNPSASSGSNEKQVSSEKGKKEKRILYWQAPMDPSYISDKPGKSPMGMDLVPVYEGEESFGSTVKINPTVELNIGVRTAPVTRRDLHREIRAFGNIDYDETRLAHIHTKFSGWIEKTFVNTTGEYVDKGQALLEIYSPELVSAQEEYLEALQNLRKARERRPGTSLTELENLVASVEKRLEYYDITPQQIRRLREAGEVQKTLTIYSPFSGIVVRKEAIDGMEVKPGMMLYLIADLSVVWIYADIYEFEVPWVKEGQSVSITLSYQPGREFKGKVDYIYPFLNEKTRTLRVRIVVNNKNLSLKPGMWANIEIAASPVKDVVAVPTEAILYSGERNLVFVSLGEGRYAPRDVIPGIESNDGFVEIRHGLEQGEIVVTSAQFLLDSESRLQESIAKMLGVKKGAEMDMKKDEKGQEMRTTKEKSMENSMPPMEMKNQEMQKNNPNQVKDGEESHD